MKHPASQASPRRSASPRKQVKLDLTRPRPRPPEREPEPLTERPSSFWKWVGIVALFHVMLLTFVAVYYATAPTPKQPDMTFSLINPGDVVKGDKTGQQTLKAASTPPPSANATPSPTPPAPPKVTHTKSVTPPKPVEPKPVTPPPVEPKPVAVKPPLTPTPEPPPKPTPAPPVKPVTPKPVVAETAPLAPPPDKPKPKPPVKPKVKVDLNLVDGPSSTEDKPAPKHTPKVKKPVKTTDTDAEASDAPASKPSLSKAQIAAALNQNLDKAGVKDAVKIEGVDGAAHAQPNQFADFYRSVRDQVMDRWQSPNLNDESAVNPEVTIYVEKDGSVPPEKVTLTRSSGNAAYDDSAVAAAKSLGHLLQPLPDGCDPVIHINFKLTR